MSYRIARSGQIYGPYSQEEVERHMTSGHIVSSDLVQPDGADEWKTIQDLFPAEPVLVSRDLPGGLPALYPDPPNLPWWGALLLEVLTCGLFFVVWDIVLSAWMRRVERSSTAIYFYAGAALFFVLDVPSSWHSIQYSLFDGPAVETAHPLLLAGGGFLLRLIARFVFRSELLRHFNGPEPIGLRLNWFLTLLFGGLYFQYHFNRINGMKQEIGKGRK